MKAREILSISNFNPLEVDIAFLNDVTDQIPEEGYIDPAMAERLATATLRAADRCVDLLAQSTLYVSYCDAERRSAKSSAINAKISSGVSATIAKEAFSDDENFTTATNKYNLAFAWQTWLENKMDTLLKTHHLCKDLAKKDYSGWQGIESSTNESFRPLRTSSTPTIPPVEEGEKPSLVQKKFTREVGKTSW